MGKSLYKVLYLEVKWLESGLLCFGVGGIIDLVYCSSECFWDGVLMEVKGGRESPKEVSGGIPLDRGTAHGFFNLF